MNSADCSAGMLCDTAASSSAVIMKALERQSSEFDTITYSNSSHLFDCFKQCSAKLDFKY